jgi:hypothetical protein
MIVQEKLQIATHNERMEQLFVHDRELLHPVILPRVEYLEREIGRLVCVEDCRRDGEVEVKLDGVRNASHEGHPAPWAFPRDGGKDVRVHRTRVREIFGRVRSGGRLRCRRGGTLIGCGSARLSAGAQDAQEEEHDREPKRPHESVVSFSQEIVKA